ncbi:MAG: phosphoribosylformylglycinamidine synthase subunit PurQ [Coriobacteriia bacterium]|nr:phosphoribosylformylglycinamidine synthase subunit PurQ [Coriobacteriia bacterium]
MNEFRFGVVVFPGSSCEQDVVYAIRYLGYQAEYVMYQETELAAYDAIILPGGFAYGNYLRPGALAGPSPIMAAVKEYAVAGMPVLGIGNGFQVLTEAGLLPGVLLPNRELAFISGMVSLRVEQSVCQWLDFGPGTVLDMPIGHYYGNYYCDQLTLGRMEAKGQIAMRYALPEGSTPPEGAAANGSLDDIAAICNERGNVFGLMPHPEQIVDGIISEDGEAFFSTIVKRLEDING